MKTNTIRLDLTPKIIPDISPEEKLFKRKLGIMLSSVIKKFNNIELIDNKISLEEKFILYVYESITMKNPTNE
jgi:hypothetical protein